MALLYNDRAVLENHHIAAAFRIVREEEHNILCNLSKEEYRWVTQRSLGGHWEITESHWEVIGRSLGGQLEVFGRSNGCYREVTLRLLGGH